MGEVYRARDTRLGREVAIKALPSAFTTDPERVARFEREARLLASLNHSNIAAIHGLEEVAGERYLVLEFVAGETLAQRLERGPLPLDETLEICRQIAAGVEAAHESGVIHRDLKPGNVMLAAGGGVKVLDFGLAKSGGASGGSSSDLLLSATPTMTHAATSAGVILGTAAYMSPEQARGRAVDRRTDIWSFGCVLYECLCGRPAFEGETVSDLVARILEREPDWSALPATTPARVRELLRRCLTKDARERLRDIGEARIELARTASEPAAPTTATAVRASGGRRTTVAAVAVALVAIAAASVAFVRLAAVSTPPATTRLSVLTPMGVTLTEEVPEIVISPDGRTILFAGTDSLGVSRLWLRPLSSTIARPLPGTEGAKLPFWSPDGREIAFFRAGMLHRMELDGGNAQPICPATSARGGAWSRRGVIVFAPAASGPLLQVPASGGETRPVTTLDTTRTESAHRFPCFLPDGTHFLYVALPGRNELFDTRVGSLDDPRPGPVVVTSPSAAWFVDPGWLVFNREGAVVAQRFDPRTRKATGPLTTIPELTDVRGNYSGSPMVTASRTGTLLQREPAIVQTRLDRVDRTGRVLSSFPLPDGRFATPRLAPDGRHVVMGYAKTGTYFGALWMADLERRTATRFTFDGIFDINPVWSQDGRWVLYGSDRSGGRQIHRKRADGSGGEDAIGHVPNLFNDPNTVSPDGSVLVYRSLSGETSEDLWLLPLTPPHTPRPLIQTRYNELDADISPDGRWIAYRSDESGRFELYLQPFPALDRKVRVTRDGTTPDANSGLTATRWRADGRELFFLGGDGTTVMSVPVELGPEPRLGEPRPLFRLPRGTTGVDVSRDGQTFVLTVGVDAMDRGVLHLAMDWARATRAR